MNFIFKSKQKTPSELVRNLKEAIIRLDGSGTSAEGKRKVCMIKRAHCCSFFC